MRDGPRWQSTRSRRGRRPRRGGPPRGGGGGGGGGKGARPPMRSTVPGHDGTMSDSPPAPVERGELLMPGAPPPARQDGRPDGRPETEAVESPAKVMRIGTMVKQLL